MNKLTIFGTTEIMIYRSSHQREFPATYFGGNGVIAGLAASRFTPVNYVSVIGSDLGDINLKKIFGPNINLENLAILEGPTFRYAGSYDQATQEVRVDEIAFGVYEKAQLH